ncbi:MAG: hypothetical protein AB7G23_10280 [Vicinamibacterales bacterium]
MASPTSAGAAAPSTSALRVLLTAAVSAAAVTAQFVGAKATRDALFLTSLDVTALPTMLMATSVTSIVVVGLHARAARRVVPSTLVPALFLTSALLFLAEWAARASAPTVIGALVYLHVSALVPLLVSGFWLIASERFDPHTARQRFGQIAGAGTLGGLAGALLAERVADALGVPAMLPVLAVLQCASAWLVHTLAACLQGSGAGMADEGDPADMRSGLRVVSEVPYLRRMATLVLLGTTSAALLDYLFKVEAVQAFGRGDQLLRFFALYYAGTSVLTFLVQALSHRLRLDRLSLSSSTSTPSVALLVGGLGTLVLPGFASLLVARGSEAILRGSLFRPGYELFYTPLPARERRAAKSVIDVAFDRLGDATGGGLVRGAILLVPAVQGPAIAWLAIVCAAGAVVAASRLGHDYVSSLEHSLRARGPHGGQLGPTRAALSLARSDVRIAAAGGTRPDTQVPPPQDPDIRDLVALRSRDRGRVVRILVREEGLPAALIPQVIRLLAWEPVAEHAVFALRKVAEERVGQLVDALLDPNQSYAVRRRLARVFSVCVSQRAADGLMLGLEDARFDVRRHAARSLVSILDKNPAVVVDADRLYAVVLRELTVGRAVWESRRLLGEPRDGEADVAGDDTLDAFVRDRAGESLAHVFTVLSLVLPREPLQIAFRCLQADDAYLRGTALEYLESVLPAPVRRRLWPFIERVPTRRPARPSAEVIADLLRSNQSVALTLDALRQATRTPSPVEAPHG